MAWDVAGRPAFVKLEEFRSRCISAGLLILISPVMLGIGLLIRIEMPGPVMVRSRWFTSDGKPVAILRFRTHGADYVPTRIGAFLRQTSLDELLHLINMLHGDFTLKDYLRGEKLWRVIWRSITGR
jgi:putative colanic acid biosynthesis UDP-glucose lipid carrier transferase